MAITGTIIDGVFVQSGTTTTTIYEGEPPSSDATSIQGIPVSGTDPTINQVLKFDGSQWIPASVGSGGTSGLPITHQEVESYLFTDGSGTTPVNAINSKKASILGSSGSASWSTLNGAGCIQLSGTKYLTIPHAVPKLIASNEISCFMQIEQSGVAGANGAMLLGIGNPLIYLYIMTNGALRVEVNSVDVDSPAAAIVFSTRYHVGFTFDGDILNLYINGIQVATGTATWPALVNSDGVAIADYRASSSAFNYNFLGKINAFRLWSRTLKQSEITALNTDPFAGL